jgi:hypothetical protein
LVLKVLETLKLKSLKSLDVVWQRPPYREAVEKNEIVAEAQGLSSFRSHYINGS